MFGKICKDKNKISSIGNNFNFKVIIFYNKYRQVGLSPNSYIHNISIMLSGQAQMYYYANCDNIFIFNQFYINM